MRRPLSTEETYSWASPHSSPNSVWDIPRLSRLDISLTRISGKSGLAEAIRYALARWKALSRYLSDGRLEMTTDGVEKPQTVIRPQFSRLLLPSSDHSFVSLFCPLDVLYLLVSDLPNPVVAAGTGFAVLSWRARLQKQPSGASWR